MTLCIDIVRDGLYEVTIESENSYRSLLRRSTVGEATQPCPKASSELGLNRLGTPRSHHHITKLRERRGVGQSQPTVTAILVPFGPSVQAPQVTEERAGRQFRGARWGEFVEREVEVLKSDQRRAVGESHHGCRGS